MAAGTGNSPNRNRRPRPEKVAVVTEVRERLSASNGALLTEYRGLKVADLARLRHSLRESGGEYGIYKNTLVRRAAVDLGLDDMVDLLVGPTAIAFVTATGWRWPSHFVTSPRPAPTWWSRAGCREEGAHRGRGHGPARRRPPRGRPGRAGRALAAPR